MNKELALKVLMLAMSFFYLVGAIVHYFGITLFPWYDGALYSPYHDAIITMASTAWMILFFAVAQDVKKYSSLIKAISLIALINGLITLNMAYTVDFSVFGENSKQAQAITESILLIVVSFSMWFLNDR